MDEKVDMKHGDANATPRHSILEEGEVLESRLGYKQELSRNRSMFTLLFPSLAIAAIPYGEGSPLLSAIYGGGQLSIFVGWIVVLIAAFLVLLSAKVSF